MYLSIKPTLFGKYQWITHSLQFIDQDFRPKSRKTQKLALFHTAIGRQCLSEKLIVNSIAMIDRNSGTYCTTKKVEGRPIALTGGSSGKETLEKI